LAILSNELDLFYGVGFRDRLPLLGLFDVLVDAPTPDLKPDSRAYENVFGRGLRLLHASLLTTRSAMSQAGSALD